METGDKVIVVRKFVNDTGYNVISPVLDKMYTVKRAYVENGRVYLHLFELVQFVIDNYEVGYDSGYFRKVDETFAEDVLAEINEQIEEEIDLNQRKDDNKVCPAVCVAMYELKEDRCAYNECGSGCGPDGKTTFNSLKECKVNLKIDGYLEIATLKTGYDVGEKIELTNPSMSYREVKKLEQSLPKSKIQNTGSNPIKGYLVFKTQQNINGEWRDYQYILDELKQGAY
ncbi:MAG: hypothetical protein AABY22_32060, partial [Nanoarchaeota archaeon]